MLIRGVPASLPGLEKSTMPVPAPTLRSGAGYIPPPLPGREITLLSSPAKSGSARTQVFRDLLTMQIPSVPPMSETDYTIRLARIEELPLLQEIERAAGELFARIGLD